MLWIPSQWRVAGGYSTDQVAEALLRLLIDGITSRCRYQAPVDEGEGSSQGELQVGDADRA